MDLDANLTKFPQILLWLEGNWYERKNWLGVNFERRFKKIMLYFTQNFLGNRFKNVSKMRNMSQKLISFENVVCARDFHSTKKRRCCEATKKFPRRRFRTTCTPLLRAWRQICKLNLIRIATRATRKTFARVPKMIVGKCLPNGKLLWRSFNWFYSVLQETWSRASLRARLVCVQTYT